MKAIIIGAPIQLEGEPAEIAQLIELVTTSAVAIEHVHRWRIAELDGSNRVKGTCWCSAEKDFDPHPPAAGAKWSRKSHTDIFARGEENAGTVNVVAVKGTRKCKRCGVAGHRSDKCPGAAAA